MYGDLFYEFSMHFIAQTLCEHAVQTVFGLYHVIYRWNGRVFGLRQTYEEDPKCCMLKARVTASMGQKCHCCMTNIFLQGAPQPSLCRLRSRNKWSGNDCRREHTLAYSLLFFRHMVVVVVTEKCCLWSKSGIWLHYPTFLLTELPKTFTGKKLLFWQLYQAELDRGLAYNVSIIHEGRKTIEVETAYTIRGLTQWCGPYPFHANLSELQ